MWHQLENHIVVKNPFRYVAEGARRLHDGEHRRRVVSARKDIVQELDRETKSWIHFGEVVLVASEERGEGPRGRSGIIEPGNWMVLEPLR